MQNLELAANFENEFYKAAVNRFREQPLAVAFENTEKAEQFEDIGST